MTPAELKTSPTLEIDRTFNATRERVFDAFINPEVFAAWWGPEGMRVSDYALDVRVGGDWHSVLNAPDGSTHHVSGIYTAIDAPSRLAFTWAWEVNGERGHETSCVLTFVADGDKTHIHLRQGDFTDGCEQHHQGWTSSFNCLDAILAG